MWIRFQCDMCGRKKVKWNESSYVAGRCIDCNIVAMTNKRAQLMEKILMRVVKSAVKTGE